MNYVLFDQLNLWFLYFINSVGVKRYHVDTSQQLSLEFSSLLLNWVYETLAPKQKSRPEALVNFFFAHHILDLQPIFALEE